MARRHISQREARAAVKRVDELETLRAKERTSWVSDYPRGVYLAHWEPDAWLFHSVKTARRLGFPVVVTHDDNGKLHFHIVRS